MPRSFILTVLALLGWLGATAQDSQPQYSFFTAGHTYGTPGNAQYGLYPPFMEKLAFLNNYESLALGCLTGDVVVQSTPAYWDAAQEDMAAFSMPLYIAAGNHDVGPEFEARFGDYFYAFQQQGDLFITLVPSLGNWSIEGEQKEFLLNVVDSLAPLSDHVFVFLHELIWWSPDSIFQNVILNYIPYYPGSTNFWTEIEPLFRALDNPVVFYAGDLGCCTHVTPFMYHRYENITLIASGMGGGEKDNLIITDVYPDTLIYHLIALNGDDPGALGNLTDFSLMADNENRQLPAVKVRCYPNPVKGAIRVLAKGVGRAGYVLSDLAGRPVAEGILFGDTEVVVPMDSHPPGVYLFQLQAGENVYIEKIVKLADSD